MTLDDILRKVAEELALPSREVEKIYRAYWKAVREHITSLPLKEDLSDEEFKTLQPNINIPSIGKLYITLDYYKKVKKNIKDKTSKSNAAHKED